MNFFVGRTYFVDGEFFKVKIHKKIKVTNINGDTVCYEILKKYSDDESYDNGGKIRKFKIGSFLSEHLKLNGITFK